MSRLKAENWAREQNMPYYEVSAKENVNVGEAFEELIREAMNQMKQAEISYEPVINLRSQNANPKQSNCCS